MAKLMNSTQLVLMPTSSAASRLNEVASMALPCSVRLKKYHSATTTSAVTPAPTGFAASAWRRDLIGVSPEKAGRLKVPLPSQTWIRPRITSEAPMVMMISVTDSAPLTGSMASFLDQHAHDGRHQQSPAPAPPAAAGRPG
jgi:hypothetical protein